MPEPGSTRGRIIAVTGGVGSGKTGLLMSAAKALSRRGVAVGGVVQPRLLAEGRVLGYALQDVDTAEQIPFATRADRVERPRFDFDEGGWAWAAERLVRAREHADVLILDELGILEARGEGHLSALGEAPRPGQVWLLGVRDLALDAVEAKLGRLDAVVSAAEGLPVLLGAVRGGLVEQTVRDALIAGIDGPGEAVRQVEVFERAVVVRSHRLGFCPVREALGSRDYSRLVGQPVVECARALLSSGHPRDVGVGLAALDSALPVPPGAARAKATDLVVDRLAGRRVCFIGHFPRADFWRNAGFHVDIVELHPQDGDVSWGDCAGVLAQAQAVFITGQTLSNGTLCEVIRRTPGARLRVLMGPSVPMAPGLLALGLDVVGGAYIADEEAALEYWRGGGFGTREAPEGAIVPVCMV